MPTKFIKIFYIECLIERKEMLNADTDMLTNNYYQSSYGIFKDINNCFADADMLTNIYFWLFILNILKEKKI